LTVVKKRLHGAANMALCWLVDEAARSVEVHAEPKLAGYAITEVYGVGDPFLAPAAGAGPVVRSAK
jgi:hypothetical protein